MKRFYYYIFWRIYYFYTTFFEDFLYVDGMEATRAPLITFPFIVISVLEFLLILRIYHEIKRLLLFQMSIGLMFFVPPLLVVLSYFFFFYKGKYKKHAKEIKLYSSTKRTIYDILILLIIVGILIWNMLALKVSFRS